MRKAVLAGAVATTVVAGSGIGLMFGLPAMAGPHAQTHASVSANVSTASAGSAGTANLATTVPTILKSLLPSLPAVLPTHVGAPSATASVSAPVAKAKVDADGDLPGSGDVLSVIASALKMSVPDLKAALASGKSLAQIATSAGVDPAKLISTLVADATAKVDALVAAGKLPAALGKKIDSMLTSIVTEIVNHSFGDFGAVFGGRMPSNLGSLANMANLANLGNLGSLFNASSLPNLGSFSGLTGFSGLGSLAGGNPQQIISGLLSQANGAVNSAVGSGLLTTSQGSQILSSLTPSLSGLLSAGFGASTSGGSTQGSATFGSFFSAHTHH